MSEGWLVDEVPGMDACYLRYRYRTVGEIMGPRAAIAIADVLNAALRYGSARDTEECDWTEARLCEAVAALRRVTDG